MLSDRCPKDVRENSQLHLASDIVGPLEALGERRSIAVGHDWGSPVASTLGLFRLDVLRSVVLSDAE